MKHKVNLCGLATVLCWLSLCGPGFMGGTATANTLLFIPHSGKFPYHLVGSSSAEGRPIFRTLNNESYSANELQVLVLVLSPTLFAARLLFLPAIADGNTAFPCTNTEGPERILLDLLGHFGLADPNAVPAVLLLMPTGFEFTCTLPGIETRKVKILGSVIGQITKPGLSAKAEHLTLLFLQENGMENFTEFLFGGALMTNQVLATDVSGKKAESGLGSPPILLEALPGEGTFLLIQD